MSQATATAHPNIALIKYWGKRDLRLNLPAVSSLSLTLAGFSTRTQVRWSVPADEVLLDERPAPERFARRALSFVDRMTPDRPPVSIHTHNDFPTGAGLASSASGFAALTLALRAASGAPQLDRRALSVLARQGSGSACRSLWGGFVRWNRGKRPDGRDSHGLPIAAADHWDVRMVVGVVRSGPKSIGSTDGMEASRRTSPFYQAWVEHNEPLVDAAEASVLRRDLPALGELMEQSTLAMHAVMHSTRPPIIYWRPGTLACLHAVRELRASGTGVWATMDAGPNVKALCLPADADRVQAAFAPHVERCHVLGPGGPARLLP